MPDGASLRPLKIFLYFLGCSRMFDADSDASKFRLDPSKFPKSIDIFVSERVVDHIQAMSAKTGRSFSESAAFILAQGAKVFNAERSE